MDPDLKDRRRRPIRMILWKIENTLDLSAGGGGVYISNKQWRFMGTQ